MKKNLYIFLFFMTFLCSYSFEWPVENPSFLRLFAQKDEASVSQSLVFKGVDAVRASGYGKHIIREKKQPPFFSKYFGKCSYLYR